MTNPIDNFVNDLTPVRVVKPIYIRLIRWLVVALLTIGVFLAVFGFRGDISYQLSKSSFLIDSLLIFLIIFASGYCILLLSIPGRYKSIFGPLIGCLCLLIIMLWALSINAPLIYFEPTYTCALKITAIATIPIVFFIWELRQIHVLSIRFIGLFVGLSGACVGLFVLLNHCHISDYMHVFLWHIVPVGLIAVLVSLIATRLFKSL